MITTVEYPQLSLYSPLRLLPAKAIRLIMLADRDPRRTARLAQHYFTCLEAKEQLDASAQAAMGWAFLRWERVDTARPLLTQARKAFQANSLPELALWCDTALLIARQLSGEGATLQDAWEGLVTECETFGFWNSVVRARNEQIAHLNLLGRHKQASTLAEKNHALAANYGSLGDQARLNHVRGVVLAGCGQLDAAWAKLNIAREQFAQLGRPVDVGRVLFEQAWLYQRREQFELAGIDLERAHKLFARFDLPLRVALCQKDLGTVASRIGDYGAAIAYALAARTQFAALRRFDMVARCEHNLGVVAQYSGLYDIALAAYGRAAEAYALFGERRLSLLCRRNQAFIRCIQGQGEEALAILDELTPIAEDLGDQLEFAEVMHVRARAFQQIGYVSEAHRSYKDAQTHFLARGNASGAAECLLDQGWLYLEKNELDEASACLRDAHPQLANRPIHLWRVLYGFGRIEELRADTLAALALYREAGAIIAELRRPLASEHASSAIFVQAQQLYQDALHLALMQKSVEYILLLAEQQRALLARRQVQDAALPTEARLRRDQVGTRLRTLLLEMAPTTVIQAAEREYIDALFQTRHYAPQITADVVATLDLNQVRRDVSAAYNQAWTLLVPIIAGDVLSIVLVTAHEELLVTVPYGAEVIELLERACLPRYRLVTYRDLSYLRGQEATSWATLRALADVLLPQEVRKRLHPEHRLLIVPSGPFHSLPWAALRLEDGWLCERAIVDVRPSLAHTAAASPIPAHASALLVGCDTFGERAKPLSSALASLDLIERHWQGNITRLENQQATRQTVLRLAEQGDLRRYGLLHIASHARMENAPGLVGHILLSDDDLILDDVIRLNLGDALVVLAACEGAASEILPGDEVLSLSRALFVAGASSVVASLWSMYDHSTLELLDHFYAVLAQGYDAAVALSYAQRALLATPTSSGALASILSMPYVWASLCVTSVGTASGA